MQHILDAFGSNPMSFVCDAIASGSAVHTGGCGGYNDLPKDGYARRKTVLSLSNDPDHVAMRGEHRVAGLLKRRILGTRRGSVTRDHLRS
jgi:hypothetical protein